MNVSVTNRKCAWWPYNKNKPILKKKKQQQQQHTLIVKHMSVPVRSIILLLIVENYLVPTWTHAYKKFNLVGCYFVSLPTYQNTDGHRKWINTQTHTLITVRFFSSSLIVFHPKMASSLFKMAKFCTILKIKSFNLLKFYEKNISWPNAHIVSDCLVKFIYIYAK